ncbi:hypothetical protein KKF61_07410 [Patescibacteria group bacterium]|nr:hypothetical protein [Patescibacteria group bacterium]
MPFGPYKDFKDCVNKNEGKENPKAYCAAVHKKITGQWPTEDMMETMAETRVIKASVLRIGGHTSSEGHKVTFTPSDLDSIVAAFHNGVPPMVPLKLGHSSDEFNVKVADALGIPIEMLAGEAPGGSGQARLGKVTEFLRSNGHLDAYFDVPQSLADLIEQGFFGGFSVEVLDERVQDGKKYAPVVSAIALLGAERPAVSGLGNVTVLDDGTKPTYVVEFREAMKGRRERDDSLLTAFRNAMLPFPPELREQFTNLLAKTLEAGKPGEDISDETVSKSWGIVTATIGDIINRTTDANRNRAIWRVAEEPIKHLFTCATLYKFGDIMLPREDATAPDALPEAPVWAVPISDYSTGQTLRVNVASNTAQGAAQVALKVVGRFLEKGADILGGAVFGMLAARLVAGKPWMSVGGLAGAVTTMVEKEGSMNSFQDAMLRLLVAVPDTVATKIHGIWRDVSQGTITREDAVAKIEMLIRSLEGAPEISTDAFQRLLLALVAVKANIAGPGVLPAIMPTFAELKQFSNAWEACIAEATKEGVDDANAYCRKKLGNQPNESILTEYTRIKYEEETMHTLEQGLRETLGLDSKGDILATVKGLQKHDSNFAELQGFRERVDVLEASNKSLTQKIRIQEFKEKTATLSIIPGTPEELATRLVKLEGALGTEEANSLLSTWQAVQKAAQDAKITGALLSSKDGGGDDSFMGLVAVRMKEHPDESKAQAIKMLMRERPELYREYSKNQRGRK